jgi:hypothetical protein
MSAMPAGWIEVSDSPRVGASPVQSQRRADRRAEVKAARRSQQRWTAAALSILVVAFGLTAGILDVLH